MLWRDLSRLARTAVVVTVLAVGLAVLMVIAAAVGSAQGGLAAFYYCMFAACAAIVLWATVGGRRICIALTHTR